MKTYTVALALSLAAAVASASTDTYVLEEKFDNAALLRASDLVDNVDVAPTYAASAQVNITPQNQGVWETLEDGTRVWRLRVQSEGAVNTNLGFTTYRMPEGARLIISAEGQELRPFTAADNASHNQLWTPPLEGDTVLIELQLPQGVADAELVLTHVGHGFRPFGRPVESPIDSGSCNVDVVCSEGDDWREDIRSVAVISTGGRTFCTGFMVNNTAEDRRPLFMTADHCGISARAAPTLVTFWNYDNSVCREPGSTESGRRGDGQLNQFTTGSTWLAGNSRSDFTIVELDETPDASFNVFYAGWDARPGDFEGAVAIHHPNTDEKRISFENEPTTTTFYLRDAEVDDGTHVKVADWDLGTTEPGSSGSPLFSLDHRVIGQLHGGYAACGNDDADWYGRISVSWNAGLKEVLDPENTGELYIDGLDS